MSSDSSNSSKIKEKLDLAGNIKVSKLFSSGDECERQASIGSRDTRISKPSHSLPKVALLEESHLEKTSLLNLYNRPSEEPLKGTATSHNSTSPTVITAVLRDLSDDIVRSPDYRQTDFVSSAAFVNGERSIAVIGGENVYVQNKTKFISIPREKVSSNHQDQSFWSYHSSKLQEHSPLKIALIIQKMFTPISNISFGLLGGVSLLQLFLVYYLVGDLNEQDQNLFLQSYSKFAELTPLLFYVLLTICIVSILDRILVKREVLVQRSSVVMALYIVTLISTLSCASYDDFIFLYNQNKTLFYNQMETQAVISDWKLLNASRCILALLGWVIFSLTNPTDLLLQHLSLLQQNQIDKHCTLNSINASNP